MAGRGPSQRRASADRLFFYFGGHGDGYEGRGYLVTYDFDPERPTRKNFLMSDVVGRHFPNVEAHHMLVALDSCSAGLTIPGMRTLGDAEDTIEEERLLRFESLAAVLADTDNKARNLLVAVTQNQPALYVNGGIFTRALIEGLRGGADIDKEGVIQFEELAFRLRKRVRGRAAQTKVLQEPRSFIADSLGTGRVLFFTP